MPSGTDPPIPRPSDERLRRIAEEIGFELNDEEVADYSTLADETLTKIEWIVEADVPVQEPRGRQHRDRAAGRRPNSGEDPHNAWITKCTVTGADDGKLAGKSVGLKDSIALAGCPLTVGTELFEDFVPEFDATVVTRLLAAGATIEGKLNMEAFAFSGSGDFSDYGPVRNPHDPERLTGGSSSGAGAAVAAGECDIALGTDQAGSVRIPAAWCGVVGLKPTTGLVPYTGIVPLDFSIDHVGPLASSVVDVARTLEVLAGSDGMDPRQSSRDATPSDTESLDVAVEGMRVGVLEEGFDWPFSTPGIDRTVREAIDVLAAEGVDPESVHCELHRQSGSVVGTVTTFGNRALYADDGVSTNRDGWYWSGLADHVRSVVSTDPDRLPPTTKEAWLVAEYLREEYGVWLYARARNLARHLRRQYAVLLEKCDALVMPTVPVEPFEYDPDLNRVERVGRAHRPGANTGVFNLTQHPAISVPCGTVEGLPVGMMFVGDHFDEPTILRLARTFESVTDWTDR